MGTWTNYSHLTSTILSLKKYFPDVKEEKYDQFKQVLNEYHYDSLAESWNNVPTPQELSVKISVSKQKVYKLIKDFYRELIFVLNQQRPIEIDKYQHGIFICVPYNELDEYPDSSNRTTLLHKSKMVYIKLPVTPRIGETIDLKYIDEERKFGFGYVHNVRHVINGDSQLVLIDVHPFHPYYHKWQTEKENYEYWERNYRYK